MRRGGQPRSLGCRLHELCMTRSAGGCLLTCDSMSGRGRGQMVGLQMGMGAQLQRLQSEASGQVGAAQLQQEQSAGRHAGQNICDNKKGGM